jgi:glycosyltransferase involved in cell wall biosynthesis
VPGVISPDDKMNPSAKPRLLIIQPALMHYRTLVYNVINQKFDTTVLCSEGAVEGNNQNFGVIEASTIMKFGFTWQRHVTKSAMRLRPHAVWIAADVNVLSSLALVIYCRWRGIKTILHGQGFVKQSRLAWARRWMLKLWIWLADKYVGYTESCTQSLIDAGVTPNKLVTISNRLECSIGSAPLRADSHGVLFVGRLRPGCRIQWLIKAMADINNFQSFPIPLHIVGDGQEREIVFKLAQTHLWIRSHGAVTDHAEIQSIAEKCSVGAYPGMAGLSVLTYMQNGLAVVVGSDLSKHMGPEPSYVINQYNGWTFDNDNYDNFKDMLEEALDSPKLLNTRKGACATFDQIHRMSYGLEMIQTISTLIGKTANM